MTCITAWIGKGVIYMGADSAGVAGWDLRRRRDPKVFTRDGMIFGYTSSFRMGQLLRYSLTIPEHPKGMQTHEYMATLFVNAVRSCLKAGGFAKKEDDVETGGIFLIGYRRRLYEVQPDYQVSEYPERFAAIGCGDQLAIAAMWAISRRYSEKVVPQAAVEVGLRAAERYCIGVRGPFVIRELWG